MARPSNITMCSFCGKSHAEVRKLLSGPGVYICDNCVILCKNLLDVAGRDGGFILTTGAGMQGAKAENVKAMIDFSKQHGGYG